MAAVSICSDFEAQENEVCSPVKSATLGIYLIPHWEVSCLLLLGLCKNVSSPGGPIYSFHEIIVIHRWVWFICFQQGLFHWIHRLFSDSCGT